MSDTTRTTAETSARLTPLRCAMLAAGAYAFVPLTVELTGDANPFWFNMILQLSLIPVVAAGLAVMARSWFLASEMPLWHLLTSRDTYLVAYHRHGDGSVDVGWRGWYRMPAVWLIVALVDRTLYVWSTHFVDTAVTATVFELWPVLFMVLCTLLRTAGTQHAMSRRGWMLCGIAPIGLGLVSLSQTDSLDTLMGEHLADTATGVALALAGSALTAFVPVATILYGELLHAQHRQRFAVAATTQHDATTVNGQLLWFTLFGFVMAVSVSSVFNFAAGWFYRGGLPAMTATSVCGSVVLGAVLLAPSAILFRKANLDTATLNVNAVFFAVPVAVLGLLFLFGERIARPWTFAAGAAVILAINIALQIGSFKTQIAGPATETSVQR